MLPKGYWRIVIIITVASNALTTRSHFYLVLPKQTFATFIDCGLVETLYRYRDIDIDTVPRPVRAPSKSQLWRRLDPGLCCLSSVFRIRSRLVHAWAVTSATFWKTNCNRHCIFIILYFLYWWLMSCAYRWHLLSAYLYARHSSNAL